MRKITLIEKIRYFPLFLLLIIVSCSNSKLSDNSSIKITVKEFNDYNDKRIVDLKGFFKYSGELVKSDSEKSYGFTLLLDTISGDSILYGFIEVTDLHSTDWIIKAGIKIEGLNSEQIDNTCNNICSLTDNDNKEKYWAIISNYDNKTDKIEINKAYRLDFEKFEFVEIKNDKIKCEIIQGED